MGAQHLEDDGEAQAGAFAPSTGGEEGVEDPVQVGGGDAVALIDDLDADGPGARPARAELDPAPPGRGVDGVLHEVDHGPSDLLLVGRDDGPVDPAGLDEQRDVGRQGAVERAGVLEDPDRNLRVIVKGGQVVKLALD